MFDYIRCKYPLPVEGANDLEYQTKDTPSQFLDKYEIREDGTLWHEDYDIKDESKAGKWKKENPNQPLPDHLKGIESFMGTLSRVNQRWNPAYDFTGEIRFYSNLPNRDNEWIEWSGYFEKGKLVRLNQLN